MVFISLRRYQNNFNEVTIIIKAKLEEFDKTEQKSDLDKDPRYKERILNIKTLFGKNPAKKNQETFSNLEISKDEDASIDVALCTELISVGVDVDRLTLMIINGQPFTTAEYIQASSRIGRSDVPGMVFVNYYKTQVFIIYPF